MIQTIIFFFISFAVYAQTNQTIRTGRPGQAIGPNVVGAGYFQIQSGYDHAWNNGISKQQTAIQNNVLRYGIDEHFEVSSVVNWRHDSITLPMQEEEEGISDFQLGFRFNVNEKPNGIIPGFGIQTRFKLTHVDSDYRNEDIAPVIIFVTNHTLSESLSLVTNWGIDYSGNSTDPKYKQVTNLSFPLFGKWSSFVEVYGYYEAELVSVFADTGVAYAVSKDLQLDCFGGGGDNHGLTEVFVSCGVSWRVPSKTASYSVSRQ